MRKRSRLAEESVFGDTNATATLGLMLCIGAVAMVVVVLFIVKLQDLQQKLQEREHPARVHATATPAPP